MEELQYTPFTYINTINKKSGIYPQDNLDKFNEIYNQFVVNMAYYRYSDTIMIVEEISRMNNLTNLQHFTYLYYTIPQSSKRYGKWHKVELNPQIEVIMAVYKYSYEKAKSVLDLFTDYDIENLKRNYLNIGGVQK